MNQILLQVAEMVLRKRAFIPGLSGGGAALPPIMPDDPGASLLANPPTAWPTGVQTLPDVAPQPGFLERYKWPLMAAGVGLPLAYMLTRPKKKKQPALPPE